CWVVLRNRKTEDVLVAVGEFDFIKVEESANALGVLATGVSEMSPIGSKVLHDPELLRLFTQEGLSNDKVLEGNEVWHSPALLTAPLRIEVVAAEDYVLLYGDNSQRREVLKLRSEVRSI